MNNVEINLLKEITGIENGELKGAYNIRKDGQGIERKITENINIVTKKDVSGIDIYVKENTKFEIALVGAFAGFDNADVMRCRFSYGGDRH